jgi:DNA-binding PadR family transcriptional regulator
MKRRGIKMNLELAQEGIQSQFLEASKARLREMVLPAAEKCFAEGGTPFTQNHPQLKKSEMVQRFFDYQPCCMSVLGSLAAQGEERALVIIRRIFDNTRYCLDEWREREGYRITFRRAQLHMALCYAQIKDHVDSSEAEKWRALLVRTGTDVFEHFDGFQEKSPQLDNRGFGTGINHVALSAEGMWKSGEILGRTDWQDASAGFVDRLLQYAHSDGYFEEHTNDEREGGPSILYTPLTAGSAYLTQHWRNVVDVPLFSKIGRFSRQFVDAHLNPMPFADERANPHHQGPYGLALHSLTPEGRGFLRLTLENINMIDHVGGDI